MLIKIQPDTTVCRYLFTAKLLYMFRVSQHPSSGVLKAVTAASGTGHNIGTRVASGWIFISIEVQRVCLIIMSNRWVMMGGVFSVWAKEQCTQYVIT